MYEKAAINLATIVNATADGEGSYVTTNLGEVRGEAGARLFLNVTALAGSATPTMLVKVVALVAGVGQDVATFTISPENASQETITVDFCPSSLKVVYTEG